MSVFKRDRDPYRATTVQPPARPSPAANPPASSQPGPLRETQPVPPAPAATAESETPRPAAPTLRRDSAAVIDKNSQLTGTLHSDGNVLVEGQFQGEIQARETVLVEKESVTEAKLCANDVIISGSFDGQIECRHRLQITATARIKGDIQTPILVVEDGSTVDCRFIMSRTGR